MIYSLASSMVVMVASMTTVSKAYWVPDEAYLFKRQEPTKSNSTPGASKTTPPKKEPSSSASSKKESPSSKKEVSSKATSQHGSATSSAIIPTFVGSTHSSTASSTPTAVASSSGTPLAVEGKSSSTGAIVGGVIAAIVAVGGIAAFVILRKRKKERQARRSNQKPDPFTMGFGSDNYNNNFPPQQTYKKENTNSFDNYEVTPISASSKQAIQQYQPPPQQQQQPPVVAPPPATSASLGSFVVIATYIPTLSDELEIETGDRIELVVEYDDGWCQGINLTKGHTKGVFPRHCIDYATAPSAHNNTSNVERSKRVSSMMYQ